MAVPVKIERRGNDWVAFLWGRSSPILRPVPGNTHPATAERWPSRESARAELPQLLGCPVDEVMDPMTSPSPAAPETPAPSLAEAARDEIVSIRRFLLYHGEDSAEWRQTLSERLRVLGERIAAALSAEEAREKLRREAAEAYVRAPAVGVDVCRLLDEWAKMELVR